MPEKSKAKESVTASGGGVIHRGRLEPQANRTSKTVTTAKGTTTKAAPATASARSNKGNGSAVSNGSRAGQSNRDLAATSSSTQAGRWWDGDEHHPAVISASLHALADQVWRPDLAPDADRPTGPPNRVPDQRLYETRANNGTRSSRPPVKAPARTSSPARQPTSKAKTTATTKKGR